MEDAKYKRDLFEALKKKADELQQQIGVLQKERSELVDGMRAVCEHGTITKGTFTYNHDSYSQTWSEGPTYTCEDCGRFEKGWDGVLDKLWW